jgi:thiamine biosynthesis protein ThiS
MNAAHERPEGIATIAINGQPFTLLVASTLADILPQLGGDPASVATAVNSRFVARSARHLQRLADGDQVTIIRQITGG